MSKLIVPKVLNSSELDISERYVDPLCKAQASTDEVDGGWVSCPMLDNKLIALGCCIDTQTVALSSDFRKAPDFEIFDEAQRITSLPLMKLRSICLKHLESLILEELSKVDNDNDRDGLNQQLSDIRQILDEIEQD